MVGNKSQQQRIKREEKPSNMIVLIKTQDTLVWYKTSVVRGRILLDVTDSMKHFCIRKIKKTQTFLLRIIVSIQNSGSDIGFSLSFQKKMLLCLWFLHTKVWDHWKILPLISTPKFSFQNFTEEMDDWKHLNHIFCGPHIFDSFKIRLLLLHIRKLFWGGCFVAACNKHRITTSHDARRRGHFYIQNQHTHFLF